MLRYEIKMTMAVDPDANFIEADLSDMPRVINENNYFNIDIKKYKLSTDTVIDAGPAGIATASVDLDPLAVSIGYGWRF